MDLLAAQFALNALSFVVACGAGTYAWASARHKASRKEIAEAERRCTALELRVEGVASRESLHKLSLVVATVEGDLKALCERIGGVSSSMQRIEAVVTRQEQWLLNNRPTK